jgi:single-stranded DNA-specific DHH superfamily exonuclease
VASQNHSTVRYNFEYQQKLRAAFIGAGGHSFRNVYPTFQYAPIDLVAVCDFDGSRAAAFARQFGARASYTDHHGMLSREKPDVAFIVTRQQGSRSTHSKRDATSGWKSRPRRVSPTCSD